MNKEPTIREEIRDYLTKMYQAMSYNQIVLFATDPDNWFNGQYKDPEFTLKEAIKVLIDTEASKRNKTALEIIDYYSDHPEEFGIKLKSNKTTRPLGEKFTKHYQHSELEKLTRELFKTQKLTSTGRQGEFETWESKGIQYMVRMEDLPMLECKDPKQIGRAHV